MPYAALLFDLDGTLINSIDLWGEAVKYAFKTIGVEVSQERFRNWYISARHLRDWLADCGFTEEQVPQIRAVRDERFIELLQTQVEWLPGAKETLIRLEGKAPMGLITGSWMSYVRAGDERLGFLRYFKTIVPCDDMGKFQKPHPHGLLLAADRLHVDPERCLYIGDQFHDVQAAHAAGMECCVVRASYTPDTAPAAANYSLISLTELPKLLGE